MMNCILLLIKMEYRPLFIIYLFMFPETLTQLIYTFIVIYRLQFFEYFQFSARFKFYVPPFMYNIKSNKQTTQVTVFETSKRCLSCVSAWLLCISLQVQSAQIIVYLYTCVYQLPITLPCFYSDLSYNMCCHYSTIRISKIFHISNTNYSPTSQL